MTDTRDKLAAVERACEVMHDAYEAAARSEGWETQERSRKPWADVPEANKATMHAAVSALLASDALRDMLAEAEARGRAEVAAAVGAVHFRRAHTANGGKRSDGLFDFVAHGQTEFPDLCDHCGTYWPCATANALADRGALDRVRAEAWGEGFMNAAGQDHPAYPRTRRIDNPYDRADRIERDGAAR